MIEYALIDSHHPAYAQALTLRHRLLRAPLGLEFTAEELAGDTDALHAIAQADGVVVGCASALQQDGIIKIRQMAVESDSQGIGIGRELMRRLEQHFMQQGMREFHLHARETAIGFYERCGYRAEGDVFERVGLPHRLMTKQR